MLKKSEKEVSKALITLYYNDLYLTEEQIKKVYDQTHNHFNDEHPIINEVMSCLYVKKWSTIKISQELSIGESQVKNYRIMFINRLAFEIEKNHLKD